MSTLWVYGDSFSLDYSMKAAPSKEDYIEWKGYVPKTYPNFICEKLNLDLINFSDSGLDNYTILQNFCDNIEKYKEGDVIIVGWGPSSRFRIVYENENRWEPIGNYAAPDRNISLKTINEIHVNRLHKLYETEINSWSKLIKYSTKNFKFYDWSWTRLDLHNYEEIRQETNFIVNDGHWSENGHKKFSQEVLKNLGYE
jgi:hypothetical protein